MIDARGPGNCGRATPRPLAEQLILMYHKFRNITIVQTACKLQDSDLKRRGSPLPLGAV